MKEKKLMNLNKVDLFFFPPNFKLAYLQKTHKYLTNVLQKYKIKLLLRYDF